jgi:hypothetical protein
VKLSDSYNLKVKSPKLVAQWHPSKNGTLSPDKVMPGSGKKVWWKCDKGHEWQAVIKSRTQGCNCPFCAGLRVCKENSLAVVRPDLAAQWHPLKNDTLSPSKVTSGSNKKVWWKCEKGHEWKAVISNRNRGHGCPFCAGFRVCKENSLAVVRPDLAAQWHPLKNDTLSPSKVTPGSSKKVWWKCEKGHEWQAVISNRNHGRGCPFCLGKRACKDNNLSTVRPDMAAQWHPTKNGSLTPDKVTPGSMKKVWWMCENGHEWQTMITSRSRSIGCPSCSLQRPTVTRVTKENNLLVVHPNIAAQWHPYKNGILTPDKISPASGKKVWWLCKNGHEWQAPVRYRHGRKGCPICNKFRVTKENNLSAVNPELAEEWHPTKNGDLTPDKIAPGSQKKVWWICEAGHEWLATPSCRNDYATGCPYCAGKRASEVYNLAVVYPEIAAQWHPTKNGNLSPYKVTPGSVKKIWWMCQRGHEWQTSINSRSTGHGCPTCASNVTAKENNILILYPDIAAQWHPTKNGDMTPDKFAPRSLKKVWWMCRKGHEWQDLIKCRTQFGNKCPYCYRDKNTFKKNTIADILPEIALEWHPTKNGKLTPEMVTPGSSRKFWWKCNFGHQWKTSALSRYYGSNCPYCSGRLASEDYNLSVINPQLAAQWHPTKNGKLTPERVTPYSRCKVWWKCDNGHEWQATVASRSCGKGCPQCYKVKRRKSAQSRSGAY